MSGFFSISIVPLEVLPGWPPVEQLSPLQLLLGIIGIPVGLGLVLALLVYAPALARRRDPGFDRKPLWLGAKYSASRAHLNRTEKVYGAGRPATRQAVSFLEEPGATFSQSEIDAFERALVEAEDRSGMRFALYVGGPESEPKEFATTLLSGQREPASTVVLVVDPDSRAVQIATGTEAARRINDADCDLAAANIQYESDRAGLASGIVNALNLLGGGGRELPIRNAGSDLAIER